MLSDFPEDDRPEVAREAGEVVRQQLYGVIGG
jgi:hypothetical protein